MKHQSVLVLMVFLFLFSGCKKDPEKIIRINPTEFSLEDKIKIGAFLEEAIKDNETHFNILSGTVYSQAYQYVNTIFLMAVNTPDIKHRRDFNWKVNIIRDDSIQTAFFLPGGQFYIYTGLLKFINSESQLLGLIGHELYYADTELLIKQLSKEFGGTSLGDILLGNEVKNAANMATALPQLHFKGTSVMEADSFSVHLLCPFQYEPFGILHVLEKAQQGQQTIQWVINRSGPLQQRIQNINAQAVDCGLPGVKNESAYRKFKEEYLP